MPTYQYICTNPDCGNQFEQIQAFTDAALTECPVCDQRVRKVYGSVGVVFKGSGFYRNDSRETKSSPATAAKDAAKSGAESGTAKEPSKSDTSKSSTSESGTSKSSTSESGTSTSGTTKSSGSSATPSSAGSPGGRAGSSRKTAAAR